MTADAAIGFRALSEDVAGAAERFKAYEALDPDRKERVRLIMALCEFARLAYEAHSGWRPEDSAKTHEDAERSRCLAAGEFAGQYASVFCILSRTFGGEAAALAAVDKVSGWLRSKGLNGIPEFVTESASTVKVIYKNASQMHNDMAELRRFAADTRREMEARALSACGGRRAA